MTIKKAHWSYKSMTYVKQRWTSPTARTFFSWGSRTTAGLCRSRGVLPLAWICLGLFLKGRAFCSSLGMWRVLKCRTCLTTGCRDLKTEWTMKRTIAINNNNNNKSLVTQLFCKRAYLVQWVLVGFVADTQVVFKLSEGPHACPCVLLSNRHQ